MQDRCPDCNWHHPPEEECLPKNPKPRSPPPQPRPRTLEAIKEIWEELFNYYPW